MGGVSLAIKKSSITEHRKKSGDISGYLIWRIDHEGIHMHLVFVKSGVYRYYVTFLLRDYAQATNSTSNFLSNLIKWSIFDGALLNIL